MQKLNQSFLNLSPSELIQKSKIKLTILPDQASLHTHFARTIADEIKQNNHKGNPTRLILPVGPILQYPILADISNAERISWKNVFTFNMDEYCDWQGRLIPETHPLSFRNFMEKKLFNQLDQDLRIPENQSYFPDPLHLDSVSQTIDRLGGIDTCYGGIGFHGHVAFNEPPVSRFYSVSIDEFKYSQTRVVDLCSDSIIMNSIRNAGGNSNDFPPKGITIGMKDILASKRIRMYCPGGAWQRYIVRISCLGKEDIDYPSTLLQGHDDYELIIDQETAMPPTMSLD